MIEQDHRGVKSRINPMLDFKVFDYGTSYWASGLRPRGV